MSQHLSACQHKRKQARTALPSKQRDGVEDYLDGSDLADRAGGVVWRVVDDHSAADLARASEQQTRLLPQPHQLSRIQSQRVEDPTGDRPGTSSGSRASALAPPSRASRA